PVLERAADAGGGDGGAAQLDGFDDVDGEAELGAELAQRVDAAAAIAAEGVVVADDEVAELEPRDQVVLDEAARGGPGRGGRERQEHRVLDAGLGEGLLLL